VPEDFNLLLMFDVPRAYSCGPTTTIGFAVFENRIDPITIQGIFRGLGAVPVWLMHTDELQAASEDGTLTMPELECLPSLRKGTAGYYYETLYPSSRLRRLPNKMSADGVLDDDGTQFSLRMLTVGSTGYHLHVTFE
jgi:hypothetical protein